MEIFDFGAQLFFYHNVEGFEYTNHFRIVFDRKKPYKSREVVNKEDEVAMV